MRPTCAGWFVLFWLTGCSRVVAIDAALDSDGGAPFEDAATLDAGAPVAGRYGADTVVEGPPSAGPFGDPGRAINGVRGGGTRSGSVDVYSIPYGGALVLGWSGARVLNGPGVDFVVFENAFEFGASSTFMDPAVIELSLDGVTYVAFPYDYRAPDETVYSSRREHWVGLAGVTPVLLDEDEHDVDPFDPSVAGGDGFDLEMLPDDGEAARIRREGFAFLRITPAPDHVNPDTGAPFPREGVSNGPDIDGVIARYLGDGR